MEERRAHPRNRTYLGGEIVFADRYAKLDCLVRNVSPNGATLEFGETAGAPDRFELIVHREGAPKVARVVWRTLTRLGVAFVEGEGGSIIPIEAARRMRVLREERDALRQRFDDMNGPI